MKTLEVAGLTLIKAEKDAIKEAERRSEQERRSVGVFHARHGPSGQAGFLVGPYPMLKAIRDVKQHPEWTVTFYGRKQFNMGYLPSKHRLRDR